MIVFLDSSALIYYFEGAAGFKQTVIQALQAIKTKDPLATVAVSRLALLECRTKPMRDGNTELTARYDAFFAQVKVVELTAQVIDAATQLRATTTLKTPDCLHAASALSLGTPVCFVTGGAGFARVSGLNMKLIKLNERTDTEK